MPDKKQSRTRKNRRARGQGVTILGSTGSVGVNTLDVLKQHPDRFTIIALTAHSQVEKMFEQCQAFQPRYAVMAEPSSARLLRKKIDAAGLKMTILSGREGLERVAALASVDIVMAAIVGVAGLKPTLAAIQAGKTVLLANKESLIVGGELFLDAVKKYGATLLPIDSEHNAIFQCLPQGYKGNRAGAGIRRIWLTASGGPFKDTPKRHLQSVTPDEACAHPKWSMGRKISVDSATLMNKGLEVIEACLLFRLKPEHIQVVIHPQSIIHSMVEYVDGSVLAQLGNPDMRTPIAHALGYPARLETEVTPLNFFEVSSLAFEKPDLEKFPCLRLAYEALAEGGTAPAILNAANEIAVASFLQGGIRFTDIPVVVGHMLKRYKRPVIVTLEDIIALDLAVRRSAKKYIGTLKTEKRTR